MRQTMPRHLQGRSGDRRPGARIGTPLPIGATVRESYGKIFGTYLGDLPTACLVPFLMAMLIGAVQIQLGLTGSVFQQTQAISSAQFWSFLTFPVEMIPGVLFAVAWHRLILLGPDRAKPKVWSGWSSRHWLFFGYSLLFLVIGFVGGVVGALLITLIFRDFVAAVLVLVLVFFLFWFCFRLSLVFPSAAIERHYDLGTSWRDTRRQGLRLLFGCVVVMLPVIALEVVATLLLSNQLPSTAEADFASKSFALSLSEAAIANVLAFVTAALGVTYLSISFRTITGWEPKPKTPSKDGAQTASEADHVPPA